MSASVAPALEKRASLWEDFIDILYAPARVFARRRGTGFGKPLLVVALLFGIVSAVSLPLTRPLLDRQVAQQVEQMRRQGMNEEQIRSAQRFGEKIASFGAVGGALVGLLIGVPIAAAVLWGVARLFGAPLSYGDAGLASTYSVVPIIVFAVVGAALLAVMDADALPPLQQMSVGPALLLDHDASPVLTALLSRVGIGDLWSLVVTAIGVSVLGPMSRGRAAGVAVALWALGTAFTVLMALRASAAMDG